MIRPIALARPRLRHLPQEGHHRLAGGDRVIGKAVAQIGHRVFEPLGQLAGAGDGLRQIAEQPRHRVRRLQIPLGVPRQPPPGLRQRRLVADAGEDVVQRPVGRLRETHTVGRHDRQVERGREIDQGMVVGLFVPEEMPLQLDRHAAGAEHAHQPIDEPADAEAGTVDRGAPDQRHQPADMTVQVLEGERASPFGARSFMRVMSRHRLR